MSIYRAQEGPRSTNAHHPLMSAVIAASLGAGLLIVGASAASAAEVQPFCSEWEVPVDVSPNDVSPNDVSPNDVTPPTTAPVVAPIAVVPVVPVAVEPAPTTTEAPAPAPVVVTPADVAAPPAPPPVVPEVPATAPAPETSVLGEVVVNEQIPAATLPVTGAPTAQLLLAAAALLIAGEAMRRMASRRLSDAIAAEAHHNPS